MAKKRRKEFLEEDLRMSKGDSKKVADAIVDLAAASRALKMQTDNRSAVEWVSRTGHFYRCLTETEKEAKEFLRMSKDLRMRLVLAGRSPGKDRLPPLR